LGLAVFDRANRGLVSASSSFGGDEVAEGLAVKGTHLLVQACRMSGTRSAASRRERASTASA
jgi:hypothetical protein